MTIKSICSMGLLLSLAACTPKQIQLSPALNSNQCGTSLPKLAYINSQKQLNNLFKQSFNNPINGLKKVDFNASALVLVSMGQKPSAGYSIQLKNNTATLDNKILSINAIFTSPQKGSINAQVITSPCSIFLIKKLDIDRVQLNNKSL